MKYSYVNQDFSRFNVELTTTGELRKEIKKIWELEKHYREKQLNSASNYTYYYEWYAFYQQKRVELEVLLENYEHPLIEKGRRVPKG